MPIASSEMIIKAMKMVCLLLRKEKITVLDVVDELELSKRCAHNWLLAASIVLPVYSPNEETRSPTEHIIYALVDDSEYNPTENKRVLAGIRHFEKRRVDMVLYRQRLEAEVLQRSRGEENLTNTLSRPMKAQRSRKVVLERLMLGVRFFRRFK